MKQGPILVINTGSSSLKLGLYDSFEGDEQLRLDGLAEEIGSGKATLVLQDALGKVLRSDRLGAASQEEALREAVEWLRELTSEPPVAIGHRVVHGGPKLTEHQRITPEVVAELKRCVHFAPLHIPVALRLIEAAGRAYPQVPQFACFDTAFHRTLPEVAARYPLPRSLWDEGIRKYGFHGLSYESIVRRLGDDLPKRTVVAHLGNGASLAAVLDGRSVDTTMGFTPTGGIPMATRSGDLDPGVLLYLLREGDASADSLEAMLNHEAGMKAISGGDSDMRLLQGKADAGDGEAALAIEMFCLAIRKVVAAYAAVLGGVDLVVFTGGIGEHSVRVRERVCEGLGWLGVDLDKARNAGPTAVASLSTGAVGVRVVPSEEDREIARHTRALSS